MHVQCILFLALSYMSHHHRHDQCQHHNHHHLFLNPVFWRRKVRRNGLLCPRSFVKYIALSVSAGLHNVARISVCRKSILINKDTVSNNNEYAMLEERNRPLKSKEEEALVKGTGTQYRPYL